VLPYMKEQGSGAIIFMGSVNTYIAPIGRAHYNAGKAALENLTKTLAREMGAFGIRVNALSPGLVEHEDTIVPKERYEQQANERALRGEMTPEDLIGPLVFLCSDDASMVTGHSLVVDGGQIFR
ncbi:MAG: SDR family oxidoreductase, partial [Dehalococcoidia bacterium]